MGDGLHGTPNYTTDGDYYFINGNNLINGKIEMKESTKRVSVDEYNKHKKDLTPNTVFVSINGTLGNLAFYENEKIILGKSACYFNLYDNINKYYIGLYIKSPYFIRYANEMASETTIKNVSLKVMRLLPIPLPPLSEQQKIVDFFTDFENNSLNIEGYYFNKEVEQKVINLHKSQLLAAENFTLISDQLTLIENLNQAILQEAVQGKLVPQDPTDEPASQLLERIKAEKAKTGKKEKPLPPIKPEEIPFEIPENWVWCRLGEICSKITDGFHNTPPKAIKGFPYIAATHVKSDKIDWQNCHYVEEKYHRELYVKTTPQIGELLVVNIGAGCGTPAIIDVEFEFSFKNTAILKFNQEKVVNKYIFFYFLLKKDEFYKDLTKGGLQPFLSLKILNDIQFPLPPLSEQQRIVAEIEKQLSKTKELKAHIIANQQATEQLLKALLHGAFEVEEKEEKIV